MPLNNGEQYIIPEKQSYSEMLKLLNSNHIINSVDITNRITFKITENNIKSEEKSEKVESKQNLRTGSSLGMAVQSTESLELS